MAFDTLTIERTGTTAVITMNRPHRRNALSPDLVRDLTQAVQDLDGEDQVRAIVLTGSGIAFSAGADLTTLQQIAQRSYEENRADSGRLAALFDLMQRARKPIIAAVNGPAVAGGCGLATVADLTVASATAFFAYTEVKIGFIAAIVMVYLREIVGEKRARDLLLTGRKVSAEEALAIGLVNEVVQPDDLMPRCLAIAAELKSGSPSSLALTKEMLAGLRGKDLRTALDYAADMNARTRATPDCKEGIAAFLEKRAPRWQG